MQTFEDSLETHRIDVEQQIKCNPTQNPFALRASLWRQWIEIHCFTE